MIAGKTVLAIIPARGGSRRAPDKNLTLFRIGTEHDSLVGWAQKHAFSSRYVDRTVLVSDSPSILRHARAPTVALPEPGFLAGPLVPMEAVLAFTLYASTQLGEPALPFHDLFVLLQPTSPYRTSSDIDAALELSVQTAGGVISCRPDRSRNGALYVQHTETFLARLTLDCGHPYVMPEAQSLDIDYPEDFKTA